MGYCQQEMSGWIIVSKRGGGGVGEVCVAKRGARRNVEGGAHVYCQQYMYRVRAIVSKRGVGEVWVVERGAGRNVDGAHGSIVNTR